MTNALLKNTIYFTCLFVSGMMMFGCTSGKKESSREAEKKEVTPIVEVEKIPEISNRKNNDISRYIAGMQATEGNTLKPELYTDAWKNFAAGQDKKWAQLNENHFKPMHAFTEQELKATFGKNDTVFYPFSGPDFLHVTTFFPEAKVYYMLALEPPGSLPNLDTVNIDSLPK